MNIQNSNYREIKNHEEISRMFQVFFNFIRLLMDITENDQNLCLQYFKPVFVKKGTILETEGTVHKYHNFITSGYMRNFYRDKNGEEVTTDLNDGPRFFTSYYNFMKQTPSNENLHCVTDCRLLRINYEDNETITRLGNDSQKYLEKLLEYYWESNRQRIIQHKTLSAKERYIKVLENQPAIIKNFPIKYIASYLGINSGSLSRIRQEL